MPRALSKRELTFLDNQRINTQWVYARPSGQALYEAIAEMRRQDRYVLHGFSPCSCGLALRSRKGDCLNCYRKQLEHVFRYTEPGYVYVLYSWAIDLIKIGSTEGAPGSRADQLNKQGYAGTGDWFVCDFVWARRRGLLENQLKTALNEFCVEVPFRAGGRHTYSRETYDCPVGTAQAAMTRLKRDYIKRHRQKCAL